MRLGETLFVKSNDLFGETTEITLARLLRPKTLLRWSTTGTASREIDGIEWGIHQSKELISFGVPVLHYFTIGISENIRQIVSSIF